MISQNYNILMIKNVIVIKQEFFEIIDSKFYFEYFQLADNFLIIEHNINYYEYIILCDTLNLNVYHSKELRYDFDSSNHFRETINNFNEFKRNIDQLKN